MKIETKIIAIIAGILTLCGAGFACAFLVFIIIRSLTGIASDNSSTPAPLLPPPSAPTVEIPALPSETAGASSADVGSTGIGDPYFPEMGNGGYDVQHYDLALTVDMNVEEIDVVEKIDARSQQPLRRFNLDFVGFDIASVKVNGAEAAFDRAEGELTIEPSTVITKDSDFTIEIAYSGRPIEGPAYGNIDFLEGWNFYPGGVIVAGEPTGAETWFPSNNHPLDKATYTFHITVAKPFVAAANGVLQERTDNGNGEWTYTWEMNDPMASYLATIAISNFEIIEGTSKGGVPFRSYLDADIREDVESSVSVLPEAVDYFSSIFGPYPFDTSGVVVHQLDIPFSLENQTLIVMGYTFADEIVVVHELAHQWYGDSVSIAQWKDIWLNEGFASYAEALWWEHTEGVDALKEDLIGRYEYIANFSSAKMDLLGDPGAEHLFDVEVYYRGALTLHALRLKVGDDAFFRILRTYFEQFRDGNVTTQDFITLSEEISNQELGAFFQDWLFEYELPDIPELNLYH